MLKMAMIQMQVSANKQLNLKRAKDFVLEASQNGAKLVMLPECFNSPYGTQYFPKYAETLDNETCSALKEMSKEAQVYLIGGSFPELSNQKYYNTCTVWNPDGERIAVHRKIHLFDIDVPGKIKFKESDVLSAGSHMTTFSTPWGSIGLGICYDMRFPELCMFAARQGCFAMVYPGAFNTTTGPLHWELLIRSRALDNQIFVAACSPARCLDPKKDDYLAWGHSSVADPMGKIIATCDETEVIVYCDLNLNAIEEGRNSIPITKQRRFDVYSDVASVVVM